ncbi:MAG TPA: GNAT family N-acetyltransferase [Rheinheimera sp.]|nr:GNAT family N-acetyltransferase [Rheinheimera sp.]
MDFDGVDISPAVANLVTSNVRIRPATVRDAPILSRLCAQLGYPDTAGFMEKRIKQLSQQPNSAVLLAHRGDHVFGFMVLNFIPQLALAGDFCRISYLCVEEDERSIGVGSLLEQAAEIQARARNCDRIELHCHSRRAQAHQFYLQHDYEESPKYFIKLLDN